MRISDWSSDVCSSDLRRLPCSTVRRSFSKCIISVPHCGQLEGIMVSSEDDRSCNSVITAPALSALTVMASVETLKKMLDPLVDRSEEHTSELQSLMRISYAVFCLKKKKPKNNQ